jgi:hypothetical protein
MTSDARNEGEWDWRDRQRQASMIEVQTGVVLGRTAETAVRQCGPEAWYAGLARV